MVCRHYNRIGKAAVFLALATLLCFCRTAAAGEKTPLLDEVISLNLGMDGYVIGKKLDEGQKKVAAENPVDGAYRGTYKFADGSLNIVVDEKSDRVLALYRQVKDADKAQLKTMVVELMGRFDAPTTMAHDKILYWAFNKHGNISEEDFNRAKEAKQTPQLGIIATVKLNSEIEITPDPEEGDKNLQENSKTAPTGTVYFIITSDPLVREFMENQS